MTIIPDNLLCLSMFASVSSDSLDSVKSSTLNNMNHKVKEKKISNKL